MTQQQVADRIAGGIHKGTVSRWESAARLPSINVLAAYAEAIGRSVGDLYRRPAEGPSLDAMIANVPKDVKEHAVEIVSAIIGRKGK